MNISRALLAAVILACSVQLPAQMDSMAPAQDAPSTSTQQDQANGTMMEMCRQMMAYRQQMQQQMEQMDQQLQQKLEAMQAATGEQKVAAIEAVVLELVQQHRQMQQRRMQMMQRMMRHMGEHAEGEVPLNQCPMMQMMEDGMAGMNGMTGKNSMGPKPEVPPNGADAAAHEEHHGRRE